MTAIRTLTVAALLSASAFTLAAEQAPGLRWDCARTGAPGHHEIATAFGFDNYVLARNLQPRLYTELRRWCNSGAAQVLLVRTSGTGIEVSALAAR